MIKKITTAALAAAMLAALAFAMLAGCTTTDDGTLRIVCTIFSQYDWVKTITDGDEDVSITVLQDSGTDLHNYSPSASDSVQIYKSDLFIYVGGESDDWAEDVLAVAEQNSANPDMVTMNLLETLGERALTEEEVPGAEEEEHDHDHDEEEEELDEHVWLSLKNAKVLCTAIAEVLCDINPEQAELYTSNLNAYLEKLSALDEEYESMVSQAARTMLLFGDRFPFRYLCEDYGLSYYAAFSGCSAETEASFSTITTLAKAVDTYSLPYVLVLEGSDQKIASAIIAATSTQDQTILEINSLQSVTRSQINNGITYLSLMEENLATLTQALN